MIKPALSGLLTGYYCRRAAVGFRFLGRSIPQIETGATAVDHLLHLYLFTVNRAFPVPHQARSSSGNGL